ncbi:hypothetical protein BDN72DRAFT_865508 [Pluteus cervinus]|uniref:Uncharacterized protein n=1 Tax=Pluteus cervinus TaxID=181527 RepID=A0ACD2ZZW3_9AGAR|nr:hypothetical protein BDN72DRAFT_865508 [Pluteus cervinus]
MSKETDGESSAFFVEDGMPEGGSRSTLRGGGDVVVVTAPVVKWHDDKKNDVKTVWCATSSIRFSAGRPVVVEWAGGRALVKWGHEEFQLERKKKKKKKKKEQAHQRQHQYQVPSQQIPCVVSQSLGRKLKREGAVGRSFGHSGWEERVGNDGTGWIEGAVVGGGPGFGIKKGGKSASPPVNVVNRLAPAGPGNLFANAWIYSPVYPTNSPTYPNSSPLQSTPDVHIDSLRPFVLFGSKSNAEPGELSFPIT